MFHSAPHSEATDAHGGTPLALALDGDKWLAYWPSHFTLNVD